MKGRKPIQIDLKKVEEYAKVCSSEEQVALCLGISLDTLQRRKKASADFAEALKRGRANVDAYVASRLMEKIKDGDTGSIIFYLKARCGWREVNRTELTGANGEPIAVKAVEAMTNAELLEIARMRTTDEKADK